MIYLCGATIVLAFVAINLTAPPLGAPLYFTLVGTAAAAYLVALVRLARAGPLSTRALIVCLALAAAARAPLLVTPPGGHHDGYRYLWDARLQRFGYNPYMANPSDPALAWVHTPETRQMNHPTVPSPYPPGAQLFFRAVTAIHESVRMIKLALTACEVVLIVALLRWLSLAGVQTRWVLAYAWNPLVVLETAGAGHIDPVGVTALVLSALALARGRRTLAALAFAVAVSLKLLPIVLAPLFWRRIRLRDAALAAGALGALYLPFLDDGRLPLGSLGVFVKTFRFNGPLFAALEPHAGPWLVAGAALLAGLTVATMLRRRLPITAPAAWAWPTAVALLLAPVVYPWYLVWLTPFLTSPATLPLGAWTVSILPTYLVWHRATLGADWVVPRPVLYLEYVVMALVGAWVLLRFPLPRETAAAPRSTGSPSALRSDQAVPPGQPAS